MIIVTDGLHILFNFNILHFYIDSRKNITSSARSPGLACYYSVKSIIEGEREEDLSLCGVVMKRGNRNAWIKVLKNKTQNIFVYVLAQFISQS